MRTALLNLWMVPAFLTLTATMWFLGVFGQLLAWPWDRRRRRVSEWALRWFWGRFFFAASPTWRIDRRFEVPLDGGPYVLVSNHPSVMDVPLHFGMDLSMRVLSKRMLFRIPFMGSLMRVSGQIPVDAVGRDSLAKTVLACKEAVDQGISVLVFPEGTRGVGVALGVFQKGAFILARELGIPIVPMVVHGTHFALPRGALVLRSSRTVFRVRVLAPEPVGQAAAKVLSKRVHERMAVALAELRAEAIAETSGASGEKGT